MKTIKLLWACIVIFATTTALAADPVRLGLWVTDSIGLGNGEQCALSPAVADRLDLAATLPTLTERDVVAWSRANAMWQLDVARFKGNDGGYPLQDHCYVLAIDGKVISSGIMLSSHSARLTGLHTISVALRGEVLRLQLSSGNHGRFAHLIHVDALDAVFGRLPMPADGQ
jgi:hypothetical protein